MSEDMLKLRDKLLEQGYIALKRCDTEEGIHTLEHYTLEKTTDPNDPQCPDNTIYGLHSEQAIQILDRYFNHVKIHGLE